MQGRGDGLHDFTTSAFTFNVPSPRRSQTLAVASYRSLPEFRTPVNCFICARPKVSTSQGALSTTPPQKLYHEVVKPNPRLTVVLLLNQKSKFR